MVDFQQVLQWRIFIDEFNTTIKYVSDKKGVLVVLADFILWLSWIAKPTVGDRELHKKKGKLIDLESFAVLTDEEGILDSKSYLIAETKRLRSAYWTLVAHQHKPITIIIIVNYQVNNILLQILIRDKKDQNQYLEMQIFGVICYTVTLTTRFEDHQQGKLLWIQSLKLHHCWN